MEGYFFNDLVAFDLNALQQATNRWEILIQNTIDGGPPHGQIPPARTNHTTVSYNDKLYLFGGTDGVHWFNDVWSYSPHTNSWTQLDCIGYIPSPREGHAAALVGDTMYIFGGRTESGDDLGDLAAFRITSRRWYTFQNMGPSPSPRSGHSMTTIQGKWIVVLAGEPSSAPRDPVELGLGYWLDTGKIRYPPTDSTGAVQQAARRPSGEKVAPLPGQAQQRGPTPRQELMDRERVGSGDSSRAPSRGESNSRLPRAAGPQSQLPAPTGPPPQQAPPQPRQVNGTTPQPQTSVRQPTRPPDRAFSPSVEPERAQRFEMASPLAGGLGSARASPVPRGEIAQIRGPTSPTFQDEPNFYNSRESHEEQPQSPPQQSQKRYKPETYQPSQDQSGDVLNRSSSRSQRPRADMDHLAEETPRQSVDASAETMPKVRQIKEDENEGPQDSGIGSSPALIQQHDEVSRELEQTRQKNAWLSSELALARKSGYSGRASESPVLDEMRATEPVFGDEDKPLVEALLKMRAELARVQETINDQSRNAAGRIAEMEKQRNMAINEAVFAKAKLAGQGASHPDAEHGERGSELSRKLASSLATQSELSRRIDGLTQQVEHERQARQLAEGTSDAAQKRVTELDMYRQQHSSEIESLREELHEAQINAREAAANHAEISTQHQLLTVDKNELSGKLESALAETQNHTNILGSLREAVTASTDKAQLLEQKLGDERTQRDGLEQKLRQLRGEHEERTGELEHTSRRLRDAEDLAEKHAAEAKTHRDLVLAGLGKVTDRDVNSTSAGDDRVKILQEQVEAANAMVRSNQAAADVASEKLRRAEERIAGLESYQEQASREGLTIRKQLQNAVKEQQSASSEKAELEQKVQAMQLETNAISVQHSSLKDILAERGIDPKEARRSRALDSPSSHRFSTPDLHRVRELEQQLEASLKSHDDMKNQFEEVSERDEKMKREYEEKLTALDNDHQAAVKYLRGTEKMLSKMKQELQRVKNENGELRKKLEKAKEEEGSKRGTPDVPSDWEAERDRLKREVEDSHANLHSSVSNLEGRLTTMQEQLQNAELHLEQVKTAHATSQADLTTLQATHTQSRGDIERMQKDNMLLEERARDAENKVQLLLDQVEHSVDNYRRQSRMAETTPMMNGVFHPGHSRDGSDVSNSTATNHIGGHTRNLSGGGESTYSQGGLESEAGDGRNSMALDSLATELDALRSHWETTNKNYRLSDKFDFERTPTAATDGNSNFGVGGGLANWRRGLELGDDDEDKSPPLTSEGTVKGHEGQKGSVDQGMALTTPAGMI